ncbi:MAG TPA: restriction endonuclease [Anaerolineae bacterium]
MNFLDAAYEILGQAKQPLHYTEITNRAIAAGILESKGQTPEASMGSRLYMDTKRPNSRFRRVSRGVFALGASQSSDIAQRIETINRQTRNELRKRLMQMAPDRFEALMGELLLALGFEEKTIEISPYGGDGGVDVRGVLNAADVTEVNAAVQAKRWKRNVQAPVVQGLRGSLTVHEQGIIITTSQFSKGAITEARAPGKVPISLIDGDKLLTLLIEHRIGVTAEQHTVYSLDEEWWGDVAGEDIVEPAGVQPVVPNATYPVRIQGMIQAGTVEAELLDGQGRVQYDGTEYRSPSGAGQVASGWKSCNGWNFWRYEHPETGKWRVINELRGK